MTAGWINRRRRHHQEHQDVCTSSSGKKHVLNLKTNGQRIQIQMVNRRSPTYLESQIVNIHPWQQVVPLPREPLLKPENLKKISNWIWSAIRFHQVFAPVLRWQQKTDSTTWLPLHFIGNSVRCAIDSIKWKPPSMRWRKKMHFIFGSAETQWDVKKIKPSHKVGKIREL